MTKTEQAIEKLLKELDWDYIADCLTDYPRYQGVNKAGIIVLEKVKLRRRIHLMRNIELTRLSCSNWVLEWKPPSNESENEVVKVYFVPRSYAFVIDQAETETISPAYSKNIEWKLLHKLLRVCSEKEQYEKCAVIKERLTQIIDEME